MLLLPALYERLVWSTGFKTHEVIASELGVTRATVTRYITGIRDIPVARYEQIERMYERTVYVNMRERGLSSEAASKYRSLTPDTVDLWSERLEDTISYRGLGTAVQRARKDGFEWAELSDEDMQRYYDEGEDVQRESLEDSGDDIEEYVESP